MLKDNTECPFNWFYSSLQNELEKRLKAGSLLPSFHINVRWEWSGSCWLLWCFGKGSLTDVIAIKWGNVCVYIGGPRGEVGFCFLDTVLSTHFGQYCCRNNLCPIMTESVSVVSKMNWCVLDLTPCYDLLWNIFKNRYPEWYIKIEFNVHVLQMKFLIDSFSWKRYQEPHDTNLYSTGSEW